jgi:hypothetical protein
VAHRPQARGSVVAPVATVIPAPTVAAVATVATVATVIAGIPKRHLTSLHGVGPKAIRIIQAALEEHRLTLT